MADSKYSSAQRAAFACLVVGFLLCAVGGIAPYWQVGDLKINAFSKMFGYDIPFIGDYKFAKVHAGLWWLCAEIDVPLFQEKDCEKWDTDDFKGADYVLRGCVIANVLLALVCSLVALCRQCCCGGGKTICHGFMAFLSGAAGLVAIGVFATNNDENFVVKYGWAFYIYIAGAVLITVDSFLLCFASPNNPLRPMIVQHMGSALPTSVGFQRLADDQVQLTQPTDFPQVQVHNGY